VRQSVLKSDFSRSRARYRSKRSPLGGVLKRVFDFSVAGVTLVLLSPMMLATGVLIRLFMGRPVLVTEERIGFEGRIFACYKFRTQFTDGARFVARHDGCSLTGGHVRGPSHRRRIECLGASLRASGVDRLPQLLNVLRGDMSLVGPEPMRPEHLPGCYALAPELFLARPGLIGMGSHTPRNLLTHPTDIALDRNYVNHWSMWLDFKIVFTALLAFTRKDSATPTR
jgi:exopolysaccharide production protein ExoY